MTSSAENLKAYCDFELVAYGPNAGKMKIVAKPTAAGKRVYQEIAAGKWKTEVLEIKADLTARKEAEDAARAARKAKSPQSPDSPKSAPQSRLKSAIAPNLTP